MTDDFDFYDLLEIDENAPQEDVKDAFRTKVREYHPDLNDDPSAPAQFTAVKKAYEILKDPAERQAYDRLGHKDYVAKRTSGIPDPDAWRTDDESASPTSSSSARARTGTSSTRSSTSRTTSGSSASTSSTPTSSTPSRSKSSTDGSGSRRASASASTTGTSSGATSNRRATTAGSGASGSRTTGSGDSTIGTKSGRSRSSWTENAIFEWWRSRNLGWPLMLTSTLLFLVGVGYWLYANLEGFEAFASSVAAAGTDTAALQSALVDRHAIPTLYDFVIGTELVAAPLPELQWYGALAGLVVVPVLGFVIYRWVWSTQPTKWVTMNETVGVGIATAIATTLYGGPLLAGAVVMPFVFLVIIRHTRAAYQFKPTYGYVAGVTIPLVVLLAEYAVSTPPLAVDLVAVLAPVLSVVVLLFSAFVRPKLFG